MKKLIAEKCKLFKEWLEIEVDSGDISEFEYKDDYIAYKKKEDGSDMEIQVINKETLSGNTLLAVGKRFGHNTKQEKLQVEPEIKQEVSEYPYPTFVEIRKGKWIGQKRF